MKEYQDYFFKKAKKENVLSRAFFKLEEIDKRHRLIAPGAWVLDLGCAPGSWLQYAARRTGPGGNVLGVDLQACAHGFPAWVQCLQADILQWTPQKLLEIAGRPATEALAGRPFDVMLSDAAPNTTGQRFVDQQNSLVLATRCAELGLSVLAPGGGMVLKIFQGPDTKPLWNFCRDRFESLQIEKPQSSRKESFEVYWVGLKRKA